jgi:hypothetical protein
VTASSHGRLAGLELDGRALACDARQRGDVLDAQVIPSTPNTVVFVIASSELTREARLIRAWRARACNQPRQRDMTHTALMCCDRPRHTRRESAPRVGASDHDLRGVCQTRREGRPQGAGRDRGVRQLVTFELTGRDELVRAVVDAGYGVAPLAQPAAASRERAGGADREHARARRDLLLSAALSIPLLVLGMSHGAIPGTAGAVGRWLQLALATPVVFGPGGASSSSRARGAAPPERRHERPHRPRRPRAWSGRRR